MYRGYWFVQCFGSSIMVQAFVCRFVGNGQENTVREKVHKGGNCQLRVFFIFARLWRSSLSCHLLCESTNVIIKLERVELPKENWIFSFAPQCYVCFNLYLYWNYTILVMIQCTQGLYRLNPFSSVLFVADFQWISRLLAFSMRDHHRTHCSTI